MKQFIHKDLTYKIIGCAMDFHKVLGTGFLESVYEGALCVEFKRIKIPFNIQVEFPVMYKREKIKNFVCDLVVDDEIVVEFKAIKQITDIERAQLLNYLKVTGMKVGLLINFGAKSLQYERMVL